MAEIVLFHHAQGLTDGVRELAGRFEGAGHTVHLPDSYEGQTFDSLDDGIAYARSTGFQVVFQRAVDAAGALPTDVVYAGISLGVMPAQHLAQNQAGARGALLLEAFAPPSEFGTWPEGLRAQIHGMDQDPFFAEEDADLAAAQAFVKETPSAELFLYPGDVHLFCDSSLSTYDEAATALMVERALEFLSDT